LASVPEFQEYLDSVNEGAQKTPVVAATADLLKRLNALSRFPTTLESIEIAKALMNSDKNRLLATREQQDAQEFLMLLLDSIESEASRQWLVVSKRLGLGALVEKEDDDCSTELSVNKLSMLSSHSPSPFVGLMAHRMGCLQCKYVENIRHEKQGPIVLSLTMNQTTTLEDCLDREFELETLQGVECPKCTLLKYRAQLEGIIASISEKSSPVAESAESRLKIVDSALASGKVDNPESILLGMSKGTLKKVTVRSEKTKHHMIARPPRSLAFHIQRSNYHNFTGRALKNQAPVQFPLTLDLSKYVTTSKLSMDPTEPISVANESDPRTIYTLKSVIVHYGLHHIGHYVAFRNTELGWFRISDEDVDSATEEKVLTEGARGAFMLIYDLVQAEDSETITDLDSSVTFSISEVESLTPEAAELVEPLPADNNPSPPSPDFLEKPLEDGCTISLSPDIIIHSTDDETSETEKSSPSTLPSSLSSRPQTPVHIGVTKDNDDRP
jgi:ubiquitin carboxyl-terminal hydrolase 1